MKKALMIKNKNSSNSMIPIIIYKDIKNQKSIILKDNKNKAGIYRWINLINSKIYIGSAIDLRTRFWV